METPARATTHLEHLAERLLSARARTRLARAHESEAMEDVAPEPEEEKSHAVLVVGLGGELFAIAVPFIEEVVQPPAVTPVPRTQPAIRGVFLHRGLLVPLLETGALVRSPDAGPAENAAEAPASAAQRVVVVSQGEDLLGLLVDEVLGIEEPPQDAWQELPAGGWSHVSRAARLSGDRLAALLQVENLFALQGHAAAGGHP